MSQIESLPTPNLRLGDCALCQEEAILRRGSAILYCGTCKQGAHLDCAIKSRDATCPSCGDPDAFSSIANIGGDSISALPKQEIEEILKGCLVPLAGEANIPDELRARVVDAAGKLTQILLAPRSGSEVDLLDTTSLKEGPESAAEEQTIEETEKRTSDQVEPVYEVGQQVLLQGFPGCSPLNGRVGTVQSEKMSLTTDSFYRIEVSGELFPPQPDRWKYYCEGCFVVTHNVIVVGTRHLQPVVDTSTDHEDNVSDNSNEENSILQGVIQDSEVSSDHLPVETDAVHVEQRCPPVFLTRPRDAECVPVPDCDSDDLISLSNYTSVSRPNRIRRTSHPFVTPTSPRAFAVGQQVGIIECAEKSFLYGLSGQIISSGRCGTTGTQYTVDVSTPDGKQCFWVQLPASNYS